MNPPENVETRREADAYEVIFRWVHVSDWHFKAKANGALKTAILAIPKAVREFCADPVAGQVNCLIHSGDVAQSGREEEYAAAQAVLARLANKLCVRSENVIITPGNHDVDDAVAFYPAELDHIESEADYVMAQHRWLGSEGRRKLLLKRFEYFHQFKKQHCYAGDCEDTNGWFIQTLPVNGSVPGCIYIASINSALVSTRFDAEDKAALLLGRWRLEKITEDLKGRTQNIIGRILIFHHPLAFLNARDRLRSWALIEDNFDIVLNGHKHGEREIMEYLAQVSGLPVVDAGSIFLGQKRQLEAAEFAVGQVIRNNVGRGEIRITYFCWDKQEKKYRPNRKLNEHNVPENLETKRFPIPQRLRPSESANPLACPKILHGATDLAHQDATSSKIVRNFYDQMDKKNKDENTPTSDLILETKYFFWHVESRALFAGMASCPEYWQKTESKNVFVAKLDQMVATAVKETNEHQSVLIVVLGVGEGNKEIDFFQAFKRKRASAKNESSTTLLFVDINYQMILKAAMQAKKAQVEPYYINADFDLLGTDHLIQKPGDHPAIVFLLFGTTFANQSERALLNQLRKFGSNTWLLFDAPLLDAGRTNQEESYKTNEAKEFTELTLRHFDKRYERRWRMRQDDRISPVLVGGISKVPNAETVTNKANSPTFGTLWMGMSHRYKLADLRAFLDTEDWNVKWDSNDASHQCWYALIKPKKTSHTQVHP